MYYYIHYRDYVFSSIPQMLQTRLNLKQRDYNFRQIKRSLSIFFVVFWLWPDPLEKLEVG
jgi:hypothetical protein